MPSEIKNNLNYGIIGNCRTSALISKTGSIDFLCLPTFSSSTAFVKLLDTKKGGSFSIEVAPDYEITQHYYHHTNILITQFKQGDNIFEVNDFMPRYYHAKKLMFHPPDVIRYIKLISGEPEFSILYDPKLVYAKGKTHTVIENNYIKSYTEKIAYESIYLYSDLNLAKIINKKSFKLKSDCFLLLSYNKKIIHPDLDNIYLQFEKTKVYWLEWVSNTNKFPDFNDIILRSALVLKLLSYDKSGAIIAAATTSLPESIGEERNWDYRFCWLRDASMTVRVLIKLGHKYLANNFLQFIINVIPYKNESIQIMYGINGEKNLTEETLDHLSGYLGSVPVRVGNAAHVQNQNDIYGILADLIYHSFITYKDQIDNAEDLWTIVRSLVRHVYNNWEKPDQGIWEFRNVKKHFVFSKVLCWVTIDRAISIAKILGQHSFINKWTQFRDKIKKDILTKGWNEKVKSFTQYYGCDHLDASNLLMEDYGFIDAKDPKYVSTVLKTEEDLCKYGLMLRYAKEDDFGMPKSSFTVCSFWMINSLYKIGNTEEAYRLFEQIVSFSNHLGLFSEDIDFKTKQLLGNFPQAYSHIALIDSAITLSQDRKLVDEYRLHNLYFD